MRRRWYAAGGIIAVLVVGACSHSGGGGSNAAVGGGSAALSAPQAPALQGAPAGVARRAALAPVNSADGGLVDSTGGGGGHGTPDGSTVSQTLPLVNGGYKIQVARMTVAVKGSAHVADRANQAETIAEQVGGEVDRDDRTSGPHASASLLLRVPPDALGDTLTQLSRLGTEKFRTLSSTDVTQRVADVRSRVRSAADSIARLRVLFHHATKIGDIIQIESELNSREADLESLQAQQRALSRETSMASITLSLVTAVKPPPAPPKPVKKHHDNAFIGGLKDGWGGFTAAAAWVAAALGTLLPFIVLLLVLGFGLRWAWPRLRPGHSPTPAPTPSE
jgi:hypothetical protein